MRDFLSSFSSPATSIKSKYVANLYKDTKQYNLPRDTMVGRVVKSDDSNSRGKYHTIDTREWKEIDYTVLNKNMIGVKREHKYKNAIILLQIGDTGRTDKCKNYLLFNKQDYIEYKKERGENKYQDPMISGNGAVWVGKTETEKTDENGNLIKQQINFRVFVPKGK